MGVGDRHSKRTDKPKAPIAIQRSHVIDDRELDDPFSAWDDDDAGAHRSSPAPQPPQVTSGAQTRVERKPVAGMASAVRRAIALPVFADGSSRRTTPLVDPVIDPLVDPLVDPVAMRDISISRARTL